MMTLYPRIMDCCHTGLYYVISSIVLQFFVTDEFHSPSEIIDSNRCVTLTNNLGTECSDILPITFSWLTYNHQVCATTSTRACNSASYSLTDDKMCAYLSSFYLTEKEILFICYQNKPFSRILSHDMIPYVKLH